MLALETFRKQGGLSHVWSWSLPALAAPPHTHTQLPAGIPLLDRGPVAPPM